MKETLQSILPWGFLESLSLFFATTHPDTYWVWGVEFWFGGDTESFDSVLAGRYRFGGTSSTAGPKSGRLGSNGAEGSRYFYRPDEW